jgi:hypothetical protein
LFFAFYIIAIDYSRPAFQESSITGWDLEEEPTSPLEIEHAGTARRDGVIEV